ncbi:Motility protein A [Fundidesulfovibrio magnetotacticus]|uniref:Motility protein A n=1 Tax=Fundidesulfovibrio magnetotacticus TaxID=2730080 RepID=A0A6V8LWH1_9BACT|nr:flagellar motor stator protein MotA [Fundidesulfovibrio magnetotacticus]GFK94156.1 Motility protein A [Fundidesulfovibrio magnetotacticus]
MIALFGILVVVACVAGGYWVAGGKFGVLFQPAEILVIGGAALGSLFIGSTRTTLTLIGRNLLDVFSSKHYAQEDYLELLSLLARLLIKVRREGLSSVEQDIEHPESSIIFSQHRRIREDASVTRFICDTFRVYLVTGEPAEIEGIMHADMESMHALSHLPAHNLSKVAESLPGLGIVAAVLGVVLTMQKITAPPDELGHSIGAALVGTFLGVLLCYGFVGPMATKLENRAQERDAFFGVIRSTISGTAHGATPMIALEFGRRSVPEVYRPTFEELERIIRG